MNVEEIYKGVSVWVDRRGGLGQWRKEGEKEELVWQILGSTIVCIA